MTFEETMAKSVALDRLLSGESENMPKVVDGSLAGSLRDAMAAVKKAAADVQTKMATELAGMESDIRTNGDAAVKKIRDERLETNALFAEVLGNEVVNPVNPDQEETK
jgi:hypothetical protein